VQGQSLRFAFYNVENLFHPDCDSINPDKEFTPQGAKEWTFPAYYQRIMRLSKVIIHLSDEDWELPALMSFAEVESAQILVDLIRLSPLQKSDYQYVHYESPDRRGIDVGLLYRKSHMRLIESEVLPFVLENDSNYRSRDMLFAKFKILDGDTISFLICHWPSRFGGKEASDYKRIQAARIARNFIDTKAPGSIIIMGDFNDSPWDQSLSELASSAERPLLRLMQNLDSNSGSHWYQGEWTYLDQILIDSLDLERVKNYGVFKASFLLEKDGQYPIEKPKRAFKGPFYTGGFSDHLPVYLDYATKTQP